MKILVDSAGILLTVLAVLAFLTALFYDAYSGKEKRLAPTAKVMAVLCLAAAAVMFFAGTELMYLLGFLLFSVFGAVMLVKDREDEGHSMAVKYGCSMAAAFLLMAIAALILNGGLVDSFTYVYGGTLAAGETAADNITLSAAVVLMFLGNGILLSVFPGTWWSVDVMKKASAPVKVLLPLLTALAGLIGFWRHGFYLFSALGIEKAYWHDGALMLAALSALGLSVLGVRQENKEEKTAYIIAAQYAMVAFGMLLLTGNGLIGAVLLATGLSAVVPAVFFSVKYTNITCRCTLILMVLYMIGLPPFGGFINRWYLSMGIFSGSFMLSGLEYVLTAALLLAAFLVACAYVKPIVEGRRKKAKMKKGAKLMLLVLSLLIVAYSLYPMPLISMLQNMLG